MDTLDDLFPPIDAQLHNRLAALCGEVVERTARVDAIVASVDTLVSGLEIHRVVQPPSLQRFDRRPDPTDAGSAHQTLSMAAAWMALDPELDGLDAALLALAALLQQHAPAFSHGKNVPTLFFFKPFFHAKAGLVLRSHRNDDVVGHTPLEGGCLLRACSLLCRATGAGHGATWTYGTNLFFEKAAARGVRATDAANALAWIFATVDHGALDGRTGTTQLVRHEPNVHALLQALRDLPVEG